jgi:hypothetical protein
VQALAAGGLLLCRAVLDPSAPPGIASSVISIGRAGPCRQTYHLSSFNIEVGGKSTAYLILKRTGMTQCLPARSGGSGTG